MRIGRCLVRFALVFACRCEVLVHSREVVVDSRDLLVDLLVCLAYPLSASQPATQWPVCVCEREWVSE